MMALTTSSRLVAAVTVTIVSVAGIALTLWDADWRYGLPTPRPPQVTRLEKGSLVSLPAPVRAWQRAKLPLLIHFFNPECPCSRFNREHLVTLHETFKDRVQFVVVAQTARGASFESPLGADVPVVFDEHANVADALGVYSTPQAVLLDADGRLAYQGNYNRARYCDDARTQFVRLALEALQTPSMQLTEIEPWGCQLPAHLAREGVTP